MEEFGKIIIEIIILSIAIFRVSRTTNRTVGSILATSAAVEKMKEDIGVKLDNHSVLMDEKFRNHAKVIDLKVEGMRSGLADNMISVKNDIAIIGRKVDDFDKVFVRKDVHDAHLAVLKTQVNAVKEELVVEKKTRRRTK